MAKLFFMKDVDLSLFNGKSDSPTSFIRAVKTDADADYVLGDHTKENTVMVKDISDDEYDNFFNGTKSLTIENSLPVFVDTPADPRQVDQSQFTTDYDRYKQALEKSINAQPNHSQIVKAQACLTFLNSMDLNSFSYPSDQVQKYLIDNNTYARLLAF